MPMTQAQIEMLPREAFPDARIQIEDLRGDGTTTPPMSNRSALPA